MWSSLKGGAARGGVEGEGTSRPSSTTASLTVALVGNPNAGKTTVFNRLTGLSHKVGNYPGVTVERKEGTLAVEGLRLRLLDLPGAYSLAAHSPDEIVAVDVLLGNLAGEKAPDIVLEIVDASNIERNLYLLSQVLETGRPVVVALNMMDVAAARGIEIDVAALSERLGVPVVPVEGHRGVGIDALRAALAASAKSLGDAGSAPLRADIPLPLDAVRSQVDTLRLELGPHLMRARGRDLHPVEALRAIIDRGGHAEARLVGLLGESCRSSLEAARRAVTPCLPLAAWEAGHRYAWVEERAGGCIRRGAHGTTWSERFDRVLTHRVLGYAIFALLMLVVFQSIFAWARPLMGWVEAAFASLEVWVTALLPAGALRSLIVDGVIAGVGMVVMFLPQILILFFFIGLLEDCGYMARAAFLMDKIMSKCGLSGKSFVPMLSGFACAVPALLATRTIEDRRDRLATMLVVPLMSCSARLPVYSVFIGTFVPPDPVIPGLLNLQALVLFSLYALGIASAVAVAWLLRRTLLRGARPPFVLELPSYKLPSAAGLLLRVRDRGGEFLLRAGTVILAIAVVVWALAYFPRSGEVSARFEGERARIEREVPAGEARAVALDRLEEREAAAMLSNSYFGRMGRLVEPVFAPLGWDWRISMAVLASFPAREVVVSTLGTVFQLGGEVDEGSASLRDVLRSARRGDPAGASRDNPSGSPAGDPAGTTAGGPARASLGAGGPLFTLPVALSILVFFALCCQCAATVVTLGRESRSLGWAFFAFGYMTALAYVAALMTYQVASSIGGMG